MERISTASSLGRPRHEVVTASSRTELEGVKAASLNGPLPIGFCANVSSPTLLKYPGGNRKMLDSRLGRIGSGFSVSILTVVLPFALTDLMVAMRARTTCLLSGLRTRSRVNFTASASSGSPLENCTLGRSSNTQVVGAVLRQLVATAGTSSPFSSEKVRVSKIG